MLILQRWRSQEQASCLNCCQSAFPGRDSDSACCCCCSQPQLRCNCATAACPPVLCTTQAELDFALKEYVGRDTPLYHAERLSQHYKRCVTAAGSQQQRQVITLQHA